MIKFFRKIRQNLLLEGKTAKYLKYAIGEIILVVIGILIAIWINKWNESRNHHASSKEYLILVNDEIKTNLEYMNAVLNSSENEIIDTDFFIQYLNLKDPTEIRDSIVNTIVDRIGGSSSAKISSSAIEDYKNSGNIGAIKSKSVRKRLLLIEAWYQTFERYNIEIEEEWDNYLFPYFLKNGSFSNSKMTNNLTKEIETEFELNSSAFVHNNELNNLLLNHLKITKSNIELNTYWIEALTELSQDIEQYLKNY